MGEPEERAMSERSIRFRETLARTPAASSVRGLRAVDTGAPDVARLARQHADYIRALEAAGVSVTTLPPLEDYPDAQFVEDVALCLPECAVLLRPGAPSRQGEVDAVRAPLEARYRHVLALDGDGTVEGGDVLVTEREVLVGLSARTERAGVQALATLLAPFGHTVRIVRTPPGVLHFKSDCALLAPDTVLATRRLAGTGAFADYRVVLVADGEEAAANAVRVNDVVLFPAGFPATAARLREAGYDLCELDNAEAAKLDGGMSCLSLRFDVAPDARA